MVLSSTYSPLTHHDHEKVYFYHQQKLSNIHMEKEQNETRAQRKLKCKIYKILGVEVNAGQTLNQFTY